MQRILLFCLLAFYTAVLVDCTHEPYKVRPFTSPSENNCDTLAVTYYKDVLPVLAANCYICHSSDSVKARDSGFDIQDTASLKKYLNNDFRGDALYGSKLFHCILHSQGALPMPPAYKLDSCSINKIARWLHLGGIIG